MDALMPRAFVVFQAEDGIRVPLVTGVQTCALPICWRLEDYAQGHEFGQLGIALNERLADLRLRARIHHRYAALVNPWRRPFATCFVHAKEAVRAGLESGDFLIAAYAQF